MSVSTPEPNQEDSTLNSEEHANAAETSSRDTHRGIKRKNAFAELMAPKPALPPVSTILASRHHVRRDGLGAYVADPTGSPPGRVIYHNEAFVAINDMYPKATVHTLLLPRSSRRRMHPFDAFEDTEFLATVRAETTRLKRFCAKELQRRLGPGSAQDEQREAVLRGDVECAKGATLPAGRDWEREILVGVHALPSMNDLHVHVLSRDMVSANMRHRKHYQSFHTAFLVDLADFPLPPDDPRRDPAVANSYLAHELRCWRCGRGFGNRFKELKEHLTEEFEEWKRE
ncbi:HIT domain-containing protein [Xylaria sp. CBS 124048]|nr:HIT domain-containing protein [Xylaria sp. CBS 124048]